MPPTPPKGACPAIDSPHAPSEPALLTSHFSLQTSLRPSPAEGPWTAEACCRFPGASLLARHHSSSRPSEQAAAGSGLLGESQLSLRTECAHPPSPHKPPLLPTSPLPTSTKDREALYSPLCPQSPLRTSPSNFQLLTSHFPPPVCRPFPAGPPAPGSPEQPSAWFPHQKQSRPSRPSRPSLPSSPSSPSSPSGQYGQ